ncbi:MAG: DUF86 domain-containing protein [Betaproteobacteria bacterium]|nr:DUF86 domain-containing protein [Betaproteobacteria bacterium]
MIDAAEKIVRYTAGMDKTAFLADEKTQHAVIRNLEIVREAARRILDEHPEFAARHGEVPWKKIYAMRNRLTHGYLEVNIDVVWETIGKSLPELQGHARQILGRDPGAEPSPEPK